MSLWLDKHFTPEQSPAVKTNMTKKPWLGIAIILAVCSLAMVFPLVMVLGFFAGNEEVTASGSHLPAYTTDQSASSHAGYRHSTLTCGTNVYVNDYEEACLQLAYPEPTNFIGRIGFIGNAKVGAIPGQPPSAYIAGDVGSEMPAYVPYRHLQQSPFDWRTATFRELTACLPGGRDPHSTTNAALIAEVIRLLRNGTPVELPGFSFVAVTNLTTLKLASDHLPGLVFCPLFYTDAKSRLYLAESLMLNTATNPPQLHARWIPVSPILAEWIQQK